jgi:phosphoribosylformylglycinamidine synthase
MPDGTRAASANPNGSTHDIAGLFNESRTILGLMPHPERACEPLHGNADGRAFFASLVRRLA